MPKTPSYIKVPPEMTPTSIAKALFQGGKILYNDSKRSNKLRLPFQYPSKIPRAGLRSRSTQTRSGSKSALRASFSKSGGKTGRGQSIKNYKRKKLMKYAVTGVNFTREASRVFSGTDCVWIGHATCPQIQMLRVGWAALLKKIFNNQNIDIPTMQTQIQDFTAGAVLNVFYRNTPTAAAELSDVYAATGAATLDDLCDWGVNFNRPWWNEPDYILTRIRIDLSSGVIVNVKLSDCRIKMFVKSALKVQNRTKSGAENDDDADDVDNVPVYGKSYTGRGNMLELKVPTLGISGLCADNAYGVINSSASTAGKEPRQPSDFNNIKYCGKIHMDPGYIKTSVLTYTLNKDFPSFYRMLQNSGGDTGGLRQGQNPTEYGKFRVFAIEKMIDIENETAINIAYEQNIEFSSTVSYRRSQNLLKDFAKVTIVA
jgi:hypothetical protein